MTSSATPLGLGKRPLSLSLANMLRWFGVNDFPLKELILNLYQRPRMGISGYILIMPSWLKQAPIERIIRAYFSLYRQVFECLNTY